MRVLIAGGGTGGHLFPGIALAEEIVTRHPKNDVVFVGTDRGLEARVVPQNGFVFEAIKSRGLKGMGPVKLLLGLLLLPVSFFSALGAACGSTAPTWWWAWAATRRARWC